MSDSKSGEPDGPNEPTARLDATRTESFGSAKSEERIPDSIGEYRILSKLGEGGMGVVFEAEQANPRRTVALKVVRGGEFVDDGRVRMFQREADTLARLKHPNIGAIYESGRTSDGQHFFAMELVRGDTLDRYLQQRPAALTHTELRFRLALFRKIADAVHYAHQRGVIHRDLKPSNIVIADRSVPEESTSTLSGQQLPEVKVLDFGLARITGGDVAATTMTTEIGVIKGTLPYMSPEQARGNPDEIDVRTDVYSLGVILYEMLSGSRPYDVQRKSLAEAVRVICDEPPRPLSRSVSGGGRIDFDIETITGKALEKEIERRYSSAAALSEDVARYLSSQPILARPPSTAYQLRKFAQRNRALVGGVVATFLVLVAGIVVSTTLGLSEATQRRVAEQARDDLETVTAFQEEMLGSLDAAQMGLRVTEDLKRRVGEVQRRIGASEQQIKSAESAFLQSLNGVNQTDVALRILDEDILERAGQAIDTQFDEQPPIAGRLLLTLAETQENLGLFQQAEAYASKSASTREKELGADHPDTLLSRQAVGRILRKQERFEDAEAVLLSVFESQSARLGAEHRDTLRTWNGLAVVYERQGRLDEAEAIYTDLLELNRRLLGPDEEQTLWSINNLGSMYMYRERFDEAEALLSEALEGRRRVSGPDAPETLWVALNLANLYHLQARWDEAESLEREVLEARRRILGNVHPDTFASVTSLADLLNQLGRFAEAETLFAEALEEGKKRLGDEHAEVLNLKGVLANVYTQQARYSEAETMLRETVEAFRRTLGNDDMQTLIAIGNLGHLLVDLEKFAEAEKYMLETLNGWRSIGGDHPNTSVTLNNLADLLRKQGKLKEAEPYLRDALEGSRRTRGDEHPNTLIAMGNLGDLLSALQRYDEADELLAVAFEGVRQVLPVEHPICAVTARKYGVCLTGLRRFGEAEETLLEAHELLAVTLGPDHPQTLKALPDLVALYEAWQRPTEASTWRARIPDPK